MSTRPLLVLLLCALAASPGLARAQGYFLEGDEDVDPDIDYDVLLLDRHLAMHTAANGGAGTFGTISLAMGIDRFTKQDLFSGLTFTLWGAATLISSATATESAFRQWRGIRPVLMEASETERRLYRTQEADRLTRLAINRAIGLAADGASLGIGIALLVSPQGAAATTRQLATSLVLNGAFMLAIDAFRTGVDDQTARQLRARNEVSERGYFSYRAPRHRGLAGVSPFGTPTVGADGAPTQGFVLGVSAVF